MEREIFALLRTHQRPAYLLGKLFRATNVRNVEGNGFGLFAAKGAIEAQGGKVWFESAQGKGTTFYAEVPLTEAKDSVAGTAPAA